jgi:hypothetical protein
MDEPAALLVSDIRGLNVAKSLNWTAMMGDE